MASSLAPPAAPIADFVRSPAAADTAPTPAAKTLPKRKKAQRVADPAVPASDSPRAGLKSFLAGLSLKRRATAPHSASDSPASRPPISTETEADAISNVRDFNPMPAETSGDARSSAEIFAEIGRELCNRREMLSLTYDEIERHMHIRTAFLAALEQGAMDDLPSPVQTRGVLANYAGFLDLDVDTIMLRFADGVQARYREKGPQQPARTRAPMTVHTTLPPLRSFIASDLVFGGGVAIMLLLFAVWGISRVMIVRAVNAPIATPPPISDILVGTGLPTVVQQVTVIPAQASPSAAALAGVPTLDLATLDPNVKVQVKLSAVQGTYMRVTVDGKVQFDGRADLGSDYSFQASEQVEILVGNAAALRVNYNQRDLGLMGNFGQVIDRLYTATGIATPTATPRPTQTPTPNVTATPSRTPTVTPSVTHTPQVGG